MHWSPSTAVVPAHSHLHCHFIGPIGFPAYEHTIHQLCARSLPILTSPLVTCGDTEIHRHSHTASRSSSSSSASSWQSIRPGTHSCRPMISVKIFFQIQCISRIHIQFTSNRIFTKKNIFGKRTFRISFSSLLSSPCNIFDKPQVNQFPSSSPHSIELWCCSAFFVARYSLNLSTRYYLCVYAYIYVCI